jgi:hypothetical protein
VIRAGIRLVICGRFLLPSASTQGTARHNASRFAILKLQLPVHENIFDALRNLRRCCVRRYVLDRCRVEQGYVGKVTSFSKPRSTKRSR